MDAILDIREYDVPYHNRVLIDMDIRMSFWYRVHFKNNIVEKLEKLEELVDRPDMRIMAFDIGNKIFNYFQ